MLAAYSEHAMEFERMAATEKDPQVRAQLEKQAKEYRNLAIARAKRLGMDLPEE